MGRKDGPSDKTVGSGAPSLGSGLGPPSKQDLTFDRWPSPAHSLLYTCAQGSKVDSSCKGTGRQTSNTALPKPPGEEQPAAPLF